MAGASVKNHALQVLRTIESLGFRVGSGPEEIKIVAVSKGQPVEKMVEAFHLGFKTFGENYWQEAQRKKEQLSDLDVEWHFIGKIQSNKVKDLVGQFELIHSVDREKILENIQVTAAKRGIFQNVLLQVNLFDESTKAGFDEVTLKKVFQNSNAYPRVQICGLMSFPPPTDQEQVARRQFKRVRQLWDELKKMDKAGTLDILSMGTSGDFKSALLEGSNCLRLGSVLLGDRK